MKKGIVLKSSMRVLAVLLALVMTLFTGCTFSENSSQQSRTEQQIVSIERDTTVKQNNKQKSEKQKQTKQQKKTEKQTKKKTEKKKSKSEEPEQKHSKEVDKNGSYTSAEDVANYIHQYGKLPNNFITKNEAKQLGWQGGSVERYAPGKCIGGDYFGNYEGKLPKAAGRKYYECDIDTLGADERGPKRLIYSTDGLIFYTENHYASFRQLY
jgi:guanyl-specific ribonuclease Sa